ncbi:MAG: serine--tRNA ligase, partial [Oligoflexales bacterium]|nr:serine--tRNA ligase [Oligoflexales bacterium]
MLDIKFIRNNSELVKKAALQKRFTVDIDRLLDLDSGIQKKQAELEQLQKTRNSVSKAIGKAPPGERENFMKEVADIKPRIEALTEELKNIRQDFDALMLLVPAPARSDVPVGKDESENIEVKRWGEIPKFDFTPKSHIELGTALDLIDFQRGVKISGARSYVLKGMGARLEQAMIQFTLSRLVSKGYVPLSVPVLVKEHTMVGTGYFPGGREQAYCCEKDEMALVGTAEVPLTSFYADEILKLENLPIRLTAQSTCFRREAGSYGKDTQGLYRVHQFQKVEQVIIGIADEMESER